MNDLLEELDALKIEGDYFTEHLWLPLRDLVHRSFVPQKTVGTSRPCNEEDFKEYRQIIDNNLRKIGFTLRRILYHRDQRGVQIELDESIVNDFTTDLLLLIGEHYEKNVWNTEDSVYISRTLNILLLQLYQYESITELLREKDNLIMILWNLKNKLTKDTWKTYPAAVACFKWILCRTRPPCLYNAKGIEGDVLPITLIITDDYVPENVVIGLECLEYILHNFDLDKILIDTGYDKVIFHTLERLIHQREAKYVTLIYSCIASLLPTIEYWDSTLNIFEWTKRDDVLAVLLDNMEFEQNIELRRVYMLSLPQLLTNNGCGKWCERLTRIFCEYCEHHTDLRTLKATLDAAKTFLLKFEIHVVAHCVQLYTAFLKLHFDLTETPVFDKKIMQNLEDCICILYKISADVGCAVINDDRMLSVIKNRLQVVCLADTKYFQ